jgi:hypothetical protein
MVARKSRRRATYSLIANAFKDLDDVFIEAKDAASNYAGRKKAARKERKGCGMGECPTSPQGVLPMCPERTP